MDYYYHIKIKYDSVVRQSIALLFPVKLIWETHSRQQNSIIFAQMYSKFAAHIILLFIQSRIINFMRQLLIFIFLLVKCHSAILFQSAANQALVPTSMNPLPMRSIDDIFTRLPSLEQLDNIVLSADSVVIIKTIQAIASNKQIKCSYKISYLLQLEGRVRSAIYKKTLLNQKSKVLLQAGRSSINRLQFWIQQLQTDKRLLFLDQDKFNLKININQLQLAYSNYNELVKLVDPESEKLYEAQRLFMLIQKQINELNITIRQQKATLSQIEIRLQQSGSNTYLMSERSELKDGIRQLENKLIDRELQLFQARRTVTKYERSKQSILKKVDGLAIQISNLQIILISIRSQIAEKQLKADKIDLKIQQYKQQLLQYQQRLSLQPSIQLLTTQIKSLRDRLPGISLEIDAQYYLCYGPPNPLNQATQNNTVVYIMNGPTFSLYLSNTYASSNLTIANNLVLKQIDIFSEQWALLYGSPFSQQQSIASDPTSELTIVSDFNCLNPSKIESGEGTISKISGRIILITTKQQKQLKLVLGACTRIQCANCNNDSLVLGSSIFWKGVRNQQSREYIQLHFATAYY